jgi:hypothetical protein
MSSAGAVGEDTKEAAREVAESTPIEVLARIGYFARGVLYIIVGLLAVQVATGLRGDTEGKAGALATIEAQPFGKFLLIAMIIGLAGYSLWGFVRAIFDPMEKGTSPKGLAQRAGYLVSAVSYGALIFPAIALIRGTGDPNESQGAEQGTAFLLSQPLGQWLVGIIGLIAIGGAIGQTYLGITTKFDKDFKKEEMNAEELKWARRVGRFGYVARGVVFFLGGFFLVRAALLYNPQEASGLDEALATLAQQAYGTILLGVVALGLISFGIYSILCTRWIKLKKHQ